MPDLGLRRFRRLTRSAPVYWAAVVALAAVTGLTAARLVGRAEAAAARYGSLRPVVVATRPVAMGTVLRPADVSVRDLPASFLPERHVAATADAVGRTAVVALFPGVPLVAGHLAPDGVQGVAALLPPGSRAVSVPGGGASAPVRTGDVVDVLATFDPSASASPAAAAEPTFAVAVSALVVDVGDDSATVAVGPEEAKRVAFAVAHGVVTLAVVPVPVAPGGTGSGPTGTSTPAGPAPTPPPPPGTPRRG